LLDALSSLSSRRIILFGGKGGVGKTTISAAAALHLSETREVILFTTDPASNLDDLFSRRLPTADRRLRLEALDAETLYARFLEQHLEAFLEIGDRGTYLDREELRRFFALSMPGIDELMAWTHIGELAESNPQALIVVDTAPTGHTLRMLSSSEHFRQLALALDAMQEKHRAMKRQFTRRETRDAVDAFIDEFDARAKARHELLTSSAAFVPVALAEPLVIEQTVRLIGELHELDVPFVVLNRSRGETVEVGRPVVHAARACMPLDSEERIAMWSAGILPAGPPASLPAKAKRGNRRLEAGATLFLAGKGGVGKTSCSASIALQLAARNPGKNYVVLSVDPAHSLLDLHLDAPPNLQIEAIDTKAKWRRFREKFGEKIEEAVDSLTPRGMSMGYDVEAMRRLLEMAPPGADELFAITRLHDLMTDDTLAGVIVDTAPTGHFLRLLDLPEKAGEWVREFMRILLRYRELIPAGSLGEELVRASRELKQVDARLRSEQTAVVVVTRPERIVVAETERLVANIRSRNIPLGGIIANYLTPENGDACDQSMRTFELEALETLGDRVTLIERRDRSPMTRDELVSLVPLAS
jgi:arsenite-transporting ATPase